MYLQWEPENCGIRRLHWNNTKVYLMLLLCDNFCVIWSLDYLKSWLESKSRLPIPEFSGFTVESGGVKKKCDQQRLVQKCTFFVQLFCMVFFNIFGIFFLVLQRPKKIRETFFSLKIKSSEKQRCVHKLFLSKSKIL